MPTSSNVHDVSGVSYKYDNNEYIAIFYLEDDNLKVATTNVNNLTNWTVSATIALNIIAFKTSVTNNIISVCYIDDSNNLLYTSNPKASNLNSWASPATISTGIEIHFISINSNDTIIGVVFIKNSTLIFAKSNYISNNWTFENIKTNYIPFTTIILTMDNNFIGVNFTNVISIPPNPVLSNSYAIRSSNGWNISTVDEGIFVVQDALLYNNKIISLYYQLTENFIPILTTIKYACIDVPSLKINLSSLNTENDTISLNLIIHNNMFGFGGVYQYETSGQLVYFSS